MTSRTIAFWTCAAVTFRGKKPKSGSLEAAFELDGPAPLPVGCLCAKYGLSCPSEPAITVEIKSKDKQSNLGSLYILLPFVTVITDLVLGNTTQTFLPSPNLQCHPTTDHCFFCSVSEREDENTAKTRVPVMAWRTILSMAWCFPRIKAIHSHRRKSVVIYLSASCL